MNAELWDPAQAMRFLGLPKTQFWTLVRKHGVPYHTYGPRTHRFAADVVRRFRAWFLVHGVRDEARLADRRRGPKAWAKAPAAIMAHEQAALNGAFA